MRRRLVGGRRIVGCGGQRHVEHDHPADRAGRRPVTRWGKRTRTPNTATLRAVVDRDGGCCRYPGCGRTRALHAHHVRFWSRGGATTPDNLILLCSAHHRALHRGEFTITAHALRQFTFHSGSDNAEIVDAPPIAAPERWAPAAIADDAIVPDNPGRLDLGYTTEVLYAIWNLKQQREQQDTAQAVAA